MTLVAQASKDDLVLAAVAALGGDRQDVNERDAFLACWHAFPNTMRWVDTALPNPETFTASLRRLEQRGYIVRVGKQQRAKRGRSTRRKTALDPGRSGVVKARIAEQGLEAAGVSHELVSEVRRLVPDAARIQHLGGGALIVLCVGLRQEGGRALDEGGLVELAFHKFPSRFSFEPRPEFPDTDLVRKALVAAQQERLLSRDLALTPDGQTRFEQWRDELELQLDRSTAHESGDLKFAARIERSPGYQAFAQNGTLVVTKPDELFRMLRVPPTTDPRPVVDVLQTRLRALARIDKTNVARYLVEVARRHNPDVAALLNGAAASADVHGRTQ